MKRNWIRDPGNTASQDTLKGPESLSSTENKIETCQSW